MPKAPKPFKQPPKRYQPKGLSILYEDHDILVADKASGLLTVSNAKVKENTAYFLLTNYIRKGVQKSKNRLFIVHCLDKNTSGVIIFAKTEKARRYLQEKWPVFTQKYVAVVQGILPVKEGILSSYLAENSIRRMYSVTDPQKGRLARTGYKVIKESTQYSLLEIKPLTEIKNQIRVQLADTGCPVAGDRIYGQREKAIKRLTLHSLSLTISHPYSGEQMTFSTKIPSYFKTLMKSSNL